MNGSDLFSSQQVSPDPFRTSFKLTIAYFTFLPINIHLVQIIMLPLKLILCHVLFLLVKAEVLFFGLFQNHVLLFEHQSRSEMLLGSLQLIS